MPFFRKLPYPLLCASLALAACDPKASDVISEGVKGQPDAGHPHDAGHPDAGHDAGASDAGQGDAATGDAGDAQMPLCTAETTCAMPIMLGNVGGDKGADHLMTSGIRSTFIAVEVSDDSGDFPIATPQKVHAELVSPAGSNFDLLLYAEQDGCMALTDSSTTEFKDIVDGTWPKDTRTVIFEVRHMAGECDLDHSWQLDVSGN